MLGVPMVPNERRFMQYIPYLFIALGLLVAILPLRIFLGARRLRGKPLPDLQGIADPRLSERDKLLFYFYSAHCGPCRKLTPLVEQLAVDNDNVIAVDVGENPSAATRFGIMATPTLVLVEHGRLARVLLGGMSSRRMQALLR